MSHVEISSVDKLLTHLATGRQPKCLFFWGHHPKWDQPIGKWYLSQWFPALGQSRTLKKQG